MAPVAVMEVLPVVDEVEIHHIEVRQHASQQASHDKPTCPDQPDLVRRQDA